MLIDILNVLAVEALRSIPNLNEGGCAVFANLIGQRLARFGIEYSGIVADEGLNLNVIRNNVNNRFCKWDWNHEGVDFGHVGIEFRYRGEKYWYETICGVVPPGHSVGCWEPAEGWLYPDELRAIAEEPSGWNCSFNRETGIPKIKRVISRYLPLRKRKELLMAA